MIFLVGFWLGRGMGSSLTLLGAEDLELPLSFWRAEESRLVLLNRN